ncbi:hypothetical protein BDF22DRAFT_700223 [Syncephalis plumigaleata]|nr:hypothetical protein BDF22DRAFT_700223 [Syncephalis plumigaleata]
MEVKNPEVSRLLDEAARRLARDTEVSSGRQQDELAATAAAMTSDASVESQQYPTANIVVDKPTANQRLDEATRILAQDMETSMTRQTMVNDTSNGHKEAILDDNIVGYPKETIPGSDDADDTLHRLLHWEDPMYTMIAMALLLAVVSVTVNQSPLLVLLAVSTLALAMGLVGFRLWALLTHVLWLREVAYDTRLATVAKYKEKITESLMVVTRAGVTWWLDLVLVKNERASFKALIACFILWMLCIIYPTWVTLDVAILCLFAFPKLGQKARVAGIYLLERLQQEGQFNRMKTGTLVWLLNRLKRGTPAVPVPSTSHDFTNTADDADVN